MREIKYSLGTGVRKSTITFRSMTKSKITQSEFIHEYCKNSNITEAKLNASGQFAIACYCNDDSCNGWVMISNEEKQQVDEAIQKMQGEEWEKEFDGKWINTEFLCCGGDYCVSAECSKKTGEDIKQFISTLLEQARKEAREEVLGDSLEVIYIESMGKAANLKEKNSDHKSSSINSRAEEAEAMAKANAARDLLTKLKQL